MSLIDETEKAQKIIKNNSKSYIALFAIIIIIWTIALKIDINFSIYKIKINIFIAIVGTIISIIYWVYNKIRIPKNKSKLPGIGFLICSNELEKHDVEKTKFFELLKIECFKEFNITVYSYNDFKYYEKHKYSLNEIMDKLNLTVLFEIKERNGNIDNDNRYEIEIISTTVHFPYMPNPIYFPNFAKDFTSSINKYIRISHKNNLSDSKNGAENVRIAALYIIAIIKILSDNPEESFKDLDQISGILHTSSIDKKENHYISSNMMYRYLEAYSNTIYNILSVENYYSDHLILSKAKTYQNNMYALLKKYRDGNLINKQIYKIHYSNYLLREAIIQYEEDNIEEALNTINKSDFTVKDNIGAYFSKSFLLMVNNRIEESVKMYIKLLNRKDLEQVQVEEILAFFEKHLLLKKNIDIINFCYAIVNYYRKDKILAIKIFDELKQNEIYKNQIEYIISNNK